MQTRLIAITGGIGSGKSVVSTILRILGYKVYDCDSRAKYLMNANLKLQNQLRATFSESIFKNGIIDRVALAQMVFSDKQHLQRLNAIVHPAVRLDIEHWTKLNSSDSLLFVETAILRESKMEELFDMVLNVTASQSTRIQRVMHRNNLSREAVLARISNQTDSHFENEITLVNDDNKAILPQIQAFLKSVLA